MGSDTGLSVAAVRHAARLASEIGGTSNDAVNCTGTLDGTKTTVAIQDQLIVQTVLAVTKNISFMGGLGAGKAPKGSPDEIDIYRPTRTDGTLDISADHYNKYVFNDTFTNAQSGTVPYTLSERCQGPLPKEAEIGVRLIWSYRPANGIPGPNFTFTEFAVEKMALCSDNCNP